MKYSRFILLMLALTIVTLLTNCNHTPHKIVPANGMDKQVLAHAENIYYELFKSCEQDSFSYFASEDYVSPKMKKQLTKGKYKNLCEIIEENIGEVISIHIHDAVYFKNILVAFRYKLKGTKVIDPIEFRLVLTIDNLVSNIGFFEWRDDYSYSIPEKSWSKKQRKKNQETEVNDSIVVTNNNLEIY